MAGGRVIQVEGCRIAHSNALLMHPQRLSCRAARVAASLLLLKMMRERRGRKTVVIAAGT